MANHIKSVALLREKFPTDKHYPFILPIFNETKYLSFDAPITIFVGENGTGKSTLLEALARACGIHIWRFSEGVRYQVNPHEKQLHRCLRVEWSNGHVPGAFFGSEIFKDFASILDEWAVSDPGQLKYFGGKSLVTQSHGESMMSYFRARYKIKGVYLLDEPETALSPRSQLELLEIIGENSRAGHAQFIIATHSPILLACAGARIYSFDHVPVQVIEFEETEHYRLYRRFLIDRQK
jgi:predicted ATPase